MKPYPQSISFKCVASLVERGTPADGADREVS
jgi:hypothetical protein